MSDDTLSEDTTGTMQPTLSDTTMGPRETVGFPDSYNAGTGVGVMGRRFPSARLTLPSMARRFYLDEASRATTGRAHWAPLQAGEFAAIVTTPVRFMNGAEIVQRCIDNGWDIPDRLRRPLHAPGEGIPELAQLQIPVVYAWVPMLNMEPPPRRRSCESVFMNPDEDPAVLEQRAFLGLVPGMTLPMPPRGSHITVEFDHGTLGSGLAGVGYFTRIDEWRTTNSVERTSEPSSDPENYLTECPAGATVAFEDSNETPQNLSDNIDQQADEECSAEARWDWTETVMGTVEERADRGNSIAQMRCEGGWLYGEGAAGVFTRNSGQRNAVGRGGVVEFVANFWTNSVREDAPSRRALDERAAVIAAVDQARGSGSE